jgi:hypothetical protein
VAGQEQETPEKSMTDISHRNREAFDPDRIAAIEREAHRMRAEYMRNLVLRAFRRSPRQSVQSTGISAAPHSA